jgi:hypothetical protein
MRRLDSATGSKIDLEALGRNRRGNVATSRCGGSAYHRRMIETMLLNLVRRHWWLLAVVAWAAWLLESVFAGNSTSEILTGSLMVIIWVTAIFSIDRWIVRTADREEPRQ